MFAELDVRTGLIISECMHRHGHQEGLKCLKTIDRQEPKDMEIHLILDDDVTHEQEDVRKRRDKHTRCDRHVTADFAAPVERIWQVYADPRQLEKVWGPPTYPATVVDHDTHARRPHDVLHDRPDGDEHAEILADHRRR